VTTTVDARTVLYRMIDLPLEKLADAVAALRNEVWGNPETERRALPRIRIWAPREIQLVSEAAPGSIEALEVWLVDLACGGIGFLSPRALDVGREFTLSLPIMDSTPVNLLCSVLHCQPAPNGSFTIGGRFVRDLADAEPAKTPTTDNESANEPAVALRQAS
jgi:hypothetical protein